MYSLPILILGLVTVQTAFAIPFLYKRPPIPEGNISTSSGSTLIETHLSRRSPDSNNIIKCYQSGPILKDDDRIVKCVASVPLHQKLERRKNW
ncbi:hypothetical protein EYC80_006677 [Monilinia laxa]|uniref:LAGLIDADG endonuclease n=1 Tax=Monilinia laxa TaxID=61186 RepID=A0A5N6JYU9_MONLA|nr:hypothetical protein EYC80_006677 [Monilinia laxa]